MATIGLDKLYYAPITEDANGNETYGDPVRLAKAISASLSVELAEGSLYADDALSEQVKEFKSGKITLGIDNIGLTAARVLTGASIDSNGALVTTTEDIPTPVAIGFRSKKSDGTYRYFWLYRVVFAVPSTELETKNDSIAFKTPSIEGTIMRRNKSDMNGKHPWKVELDEPTASSTPLQRGIDITYDAGKTTSAIELWYEKVYEPTYPVSIVVTPSRSVQVGEKVTLSVSPITSTGALRTSYGWYETEQPTASGGELLSEGTSSLYETSTFETSGDYHFYCKITKHDGIADETIIISDIVTIQVTQAMAE